MLEDTTNPKPSPAPQAGEANSPNGELPALSARSAPLKGASGPADHRLSRPNSVTGFELTKANLAQHSDPNPYVRKAVTSCTSNDVMSEGTESEYNNRTANPGQKKGRKAYTMTKRRERWTKEEHELFLEAVKLYGREWRKIQEHIGTKTAIQIRSHAQKFFGKVEKGIAETEIEVPPPRPKKKSASELAAAAAASSGSKRDNEQQSPSKANSVHAEPTSATQGAKGSAGTLDPGITSMADAIANNISTSIASWAAWSDIKGFKQDGNEVGATLDHTVNCVAAAASVAAAAAATAVIAAAGEPIYLSLQEKARAGELSPLVTQALVGMQGGPWRAGAGTQHQHQHPHHEQEEQVQGHQAQQKEQPQRGVHKRPILSPSAEAAPEAALVPVLQDKRDGSAEDEVGGSGGRSGSGGCGSGDGSGGEGHEGSNPTASNQKGGSGGDGSGGDGSGGDGSGGDGSGGDGSGSRPPTQAQGASTQPVVEDSNVTRTSMAQLAARRAAAAVVHGHLDVKTAHQWLAQLLQTMSSNLGSGSTDSTAFRETLGRDGSGNGNELGSGTGNEVNIGSGTGLGLNGNGSDPSRNNANGSGTGGSGNGSDPSRNNANGSGNGSDPSDRSRDRSSDPESQEKNMVTREAGHPGAAADNEPYTSSQSPEEENHAQNLKSGSGSGGEVETLKESEEPAAPNKKRQAPVSAPTRHQDETWSSGHSPAQNGLELRSRKDPAPAEVPAQARSGEKPQLPRTVFPDTANKQKSPNGSGKRLAPTMASVYPSPSKKQHFGNAKDDRDIMPPPPPASWYTEHRRHFEGNMDAAGVGPPLPVRPRYRGEAMFEKGKPEGPGGRGLMGPWDWSHPMAAHQRNDPQSWQMSHPIVAHARQSMPPVSGGMFPAWPGRRPGMDWPNGSKGPMGAGPFPMQHGSGPPVRMGMMPPRMMPPGMPGGPPMVGPLPFGDRNGQRVDSSVEALQMWFQQQQQMLYSWSDHEASHGALGPSLKNGGFRNTTDNGKALQAAFSAAPSPPRPPDPAAGLSKDSRRRRNFGDTKPGSNGGIMPLPVPSHVPPALSNQMLVNQMMMNMSMYGAFPNSMKGFAKDDRRAEDEAKDRQGMESGHGGSMMKPQPAGVHRDGRPPSQAGSSPTHPSHSGGAGGGANVNVSPSTSHEALLKGPRADAAANGDFAAAAAAAMAAAAAAMGGFDAQTSPAAPASDQGNAISCEESMEQDGERPSGGGLPPSSSARRQQQQDSSLKRPNPQGLFQSSKNARKAKRRKHRGDPNSPTRSVGSGASSSGFQGDYRSGGEECPSHQHSYQQSDYHSGGGGPSQGNTTVSSMKYLLQVAAAQVQTQSLQQKAAHAAAAAAVEAAAVVTGEQEPPDANGCKEPECTAKGPSEAANGGPKGRSDMQQRGESRGPATRQLAEQLRSSGEFGVSTSNGSDEGSNEPSDNGANKGNAARDQYTPAQEYEEQVHAATADA